MLSFSQETVVAFFIASLYECSNHLLSLYFAEHSQFKSPVNCFDTVIHVYPITSQTFEHANQIESEHNPQVDIARDTDTNQFYVSAFEDIKRPSLTF